MVTLFHILTHIHTTYHTNTHRHTQTRKPVPHCPNVSQQTHNYTDGLIARTNDMRSVFFTSLQCPNKETNIHINVYRFTFRLHVYQRQISEPSFTRPLNDLQKHIVKKNKTTKNPIKKTTILFDAEFETIGLLNACQLLMTAQK